jgi:hypothetical protein
LNPKNKEKITEIPGSKAFSTYFQVFSKNLSAMDRTGVITIPLKTKILPHMVMPEYRIFKKTFEEICDDRIKFILKQIDSENKKLAVMYSGGIDSTLILCSLLKCATPEQLKNTIVLLSDESIIENTKFYYDYVAKYFNCVSSYRFPYFLGKNEYLFLTGENADQVFGSQVNDDLTRNRPYEILFESLESKTGTIIDYFSDKLDNDTKKYAEPFFHLLKRLTDSSPVKIDNVYTFFWWINFTTKWQNVYTRILPYSMNISTIRLEKNYTSFYCTEEFQLWSMNNTPNFLIEDYKDVKMAAKKYIVNVNGDQSYLKKPKVGSLYTLMKRKNIGLMLDDNMNSINEWPSEELINYENSFTEML